jgi:hypothetical protein
MNNLEIWFLLKQIIPTDIVSLIIIFKIKMTKMKINCHSDNKSYVINGVGYVWGNNEYGQLGLGHYSYVKYPVRLKLDNIKNIKHGFKFTYVLTNDGNLYRCGDYNFESGYYDRNQLQFVMDNVKKVNCACGEITLIKYDGQVIHQDYESREFCGCSLISKVDIKKTEYNCNLYNDGKFVSNKIVRDNVKNFYTYMTRLVAYTTEDDLIYENLTVKGRKPTFGNDRMHYLDMDYYLKDSRGTNYDIRLKDIKNYNVKGTLLVRDIYDRVGIYNLESREFVESKSNWSVLNMLPNNLGYVVLSVLQGFSIGLIIIVLLIS